MEDNQLSFVSKIYFPHGVFIGPRGLTFLKTLSGKKKYFIVSKSFAKDNKELLSGIIGEDESVIREGEPTIKEYELLVEEVRRKKTEVLVGIGGGSVIDLAKALKKECNLMLVVIPTTIGSGSEVSQFAVFIDDAGRKKVLTSDKFLPDAVIIDSKFLISLTRDQIITQSLDSFAHAIEALVSKMSNSFSDALSLTSIENIYSLLLSQELKEAKTLENIKSYSLLAGLAQSSVGTGIVHSFAHVIGALCSISHSEAVGMFLVDGIGLNIDNTDKYNKLNSLKELSKENIIENLTLLLKHLNIKFPKITIPKEKLKKTAEDIQKDICTLSNPYNPNVEEVEQILKRHL